MVVPKGKELSEKPYRRANAEITTNHKISLLLREFADLLEQQGEDGFRQRAYRRAADTLGIFGTPSLTIGKTLIIGSLDSPTLGAILKDNGSSIC